MRTSQGGARIIQTNKKKNTSQSRRLRDIGWIPRWRRFSGEGKWQLTPVSLPGESHGQRNLVGSGPVQFSSTTQSCPNFCDPMDWSTPGSPVHHQLPESTQTHVHRVGHAIQPSHPLLSPSPPAFNLSQHLCLFQWVSSLPKYWSFSFNISPSNEYSGMIFFRMEWLDLLAVQGTLKSLSNTTVQKHQFFSTQLSL